MYIACNKSEIFQLKPIWTCHIEKSLFPNHIIYPQISIYIFDLPDVFRILEPIQANYFLLILLFQ